ncbi:Hypothetical predicted protein [Olea europaea subsp. europaea]|uniref:Uncharacterized protein n=1 Tax=Olea europaea subsp. europaea TaxID=158383 RepID=A0A8S0V4P9_OLEEU|nr:Hypothetical predicted protein [Olea europaea subsp. europaea]
MDSDDDYQSFLPPKESSPKVQYRRLKRLKKSNSEPPKESWKVSINDPLLFPQVNYAKLEALENGSETLDFNDSILNQEPFMSQESQSEGFDDEKENELENQKQKEVNSVVNKTKRALQFDDGVAVGFEKENGLENPKEKEVNFGIGAEVNKTKRGLEFDDNVAVVFDGYEGGIGRNVDLGLDSFERKRSCEGDLDEIKEDKKKKKKKVKSDNANESVSKLPVSNKRKEEKERKVYLQQLHAESQKLLRDTRDAAFEPIPVVQKPISFVLEKIRKRKLEVSLRTGMLNHKNYATEDNGSQRDKMMEVDLVNTDSEKRGAENIAKNVENEAPARSVDVESGPNTLRMDGSEDLARKTSHENVPTQVASEALNELPTPAFRAPVDDTQDLFDDSQPSINIVEKPDELQDSPLEEDFAPSLLAMNLKFDSAPVDDRFSDEEDSEKENIDPYPCGVADGSSSPKGDPVKDFVDDEAEEEDDSDNDLIRSEEKEDEDMDGFEELDDMIATEFEERTIDNERRNELHQKWLEQQDAAGTDHLLQRLKCRSELRDTILQDKEPESDEDEEESDDEAKEDVHRNSARMNSRNAKEIIMQMFSDKEEAFLSDEDDTEKRHVKQRLLIRAEKQATLVSPADDENSREVFGLIKKLNIVSDNKKKPKTSSFFDTLLKGGSSNSSSETLLHLHQNEHSGRSSSFLGRASNLHIPLSHKQGSGMVRSFIFGRDDSNSRSSISVSEDSLDSISRESRRTRNATAKFSSSQSKFSSQKGETASEKASNTSLFEILKRSSSQSHACNQESMADLPKSMFASFRIPKKPMKMEGKS